MTHPGFDRQNPPFWRTKPLGEMSLAEWESLCDGCGRCCLVKLEDEDTGAIYKTDVACALFEDTTCRCRDYDNRHDKIADCVRLAPDTIRDMGWLPDTCGYRLVAEGRDLHWWHPLVSGDPDTVHQAGISVRGQTVSEYGLSLEEIARRVTNLPEMGDDMEFVPVEAGE